MSLRAIRRLAASLVVAGSVTAGAPNVVAGQEDVEALRSRLDRVLGSYPSPRLQWGVQVQSLETGETLFDRDAGAALTPASNVKLLTSAAALHVLGPDYRFRTWLLTDGSIEGDVLRGDLTLYGTGDPGISDRFFGKRDEVFQRLIDELEILGVRTIEGDLRADASFLPGPLRDSTWDPRDLNEHFTAAVSALSYNENVVSFRIQPGPVGAAPIVETVPGHSALQVDNRAETVVGRARPRLAILRDDPLEPVRIEGRMTRGARDAWRQMTVAVPAEFAGASFRAALADRGIVLTGRVRVVERPSESVVGRRLAAPGLGRGSTRILATHVSPPLSDYLVVVNKQSHNLFAELIFRALGRVGAGVGSPEASAQVVRGTLAQIGVDTDGLVQIDGSGLAAANRVSAATFVQVMRAMSEGPLWPEFWASLPQAGTRRELGRMYRTAAAGNLRAKTGTIEGVSALSGMVRSRDGERLAFSILVNDSPSQSRAKRVENLVGEALADFRRAPGRVPSMADASNAPPVRSTTAAGDRHRVTSGENLSTIAARYGVAVSEILAINPRVEANVIQAGQWLDIPRRATGS